MERVVELWPGGFFVEDCEEILAVRRAASREIA